MSTKLRVKQLQGPQENYVHEKPNPQIEPNPEYGGLRVRKVGPKGTPSVRTHPHHPERRALDALGTPRHENADKSQKP
jgi:hypothetical protein